jgi:hypothetical protein
MALEMELEWEGRIASDNNIDRAEESRGKPFGAAETMEPPLGGT